MNKLILIPVIIFLFSSCFEERIDLDLNTDNRKIVVNAWISNLDEPQFVNLSYTTNYLGDVTPEFINNAIVNLKTTSNDYQMINQGDGNYFLPSNWIKEIGEAYTLNILYEDEIYVASQIMRPCPEIVNPRFELYDFKDIDTIDLYETVFEFQEIPGEGDAYYLIDYKKGSIDGDSLFNGVYANDSFVDGEYIDDIRLSEENRLYAIGDTAVIELYSLGEEAVDYLTDIENEVFRGGPFDPPPANVRSNISNGALGYFIIAEAKTLDLVVE